MTRLITKNTGINPIDMSNAIRVSQEYMADHNLSGWLLRDYLGTNPVIWKVLGRSVRNVTRPFWLFVPVSGLPVLIAHSVDAGRFFELTHVNNDYEPRLKIYDSRKSMVRELHMVIPKHGKIAMEYSPNGELPRVGRVDAGSIELLRDIGVNVVSSGNIIQYATERWSHDQINTHKLAAGQLTDIVKYAFEFVAENINWRISEYDLAEHIRGLYDRCDLESSDGPVVAVDAHSSDPHYEPKFDQSAVIRKRNWLLLDLWARTKGNPESIYADITWIAYLGKEPPPEHQRAFDAVKEARDRAVEFISESYKNTGPPQGWEVDRSARTVLERMGYSKYFTHRLGHSLGTTVHSNAVNLDDWETHDTRLLIPGLGVTIEPGVYLGDFGVRSEIDIYLRDAGPEITTVPQAEIFLIDV